VKTVLGVVTLAYFLDLLLGDPRVRWHPVRGIGRLVLFWERVLYDREGDRKFLGILLLLLTSITALTVTTGLLWLGRAVHPYVNYGVSVVLIYFALSVKDLAVEADQVRKALEEKDVLRARENLSLIVGRDTANLEEPEIVRAAVETVAESTMDGIVAPLFYAFLGGPLLAWFYKTVNTLDSMVGYENDRYRDFGWASAKLDAWLNLIPAKITALLIGAAMIVLRKRWRSSFRWTGRFFFSGPSGNGDITEAAMAGGLGVRLGGRNVYAGKVVDNAFLGEAVEPLKPGHIRVAVRTAYIVSGLTVLGGWAALHLWR
jgi:adenosylcobinamide-phosphate synthase